MDPIIKIENVNLWYEKGKPIEVHALKNINLEIERGDYVAFFGPSGCGKTSMLYSISGIDRFQEGRVLINGKDISGLPNQELAIFRQTGIGIVFQQFNLVPSLSVLKNIALPMLFVGVTSEKAEIEAQKLLDRLNLTDLANRYPYELSGGQQQRVGIARALANNPPIIIADEPLGNLDSVNAKIVLEFLRELNEKDGRTVIMVTHEAWSLKDAKTIFHMKDGVILEVEKIKEARVGPLDGAVDDIAEHLNRLAPVEDKTPFAFFIGLEVAVIGTVDLVCTKLPAEQLAHIPAEVERPVEIQHQVSGLFSQDRLAQIAKLKRLSMNYHPVYSTQSIATTYTLTHPHHPPA